MLNFLKKIRSHLENVGSTPIAVAPEKSQGVDANASSVAAHCKREGNNYLGHGDFEKAKACYLQAISVKPDYAEAHVNLGFVLREQKLFVEAEQALEQAILLNPEMEDAYYLLATVLQELGKLSDAIVNYNKAIELKPNFEMVYLDLGRALFQEGQVENAEIAIAKSIELYPGNADFHYFRGKLFAHAGEPDQAVECFVRALSIQPNFAEGHNDLGLQLQAQNKFDAAIESYQKALSFKSDYAEALANMAFALQSQGKLDAAIVNYRSALTINPNFVAVRNNLASVLQAQDKPEEAIEHLQKAVAIDPDYAEAHSNLGVAFQLHGKFAAAAQSCRMALSIKPNFAEAHSNLADALQALDNLDAAVESYQRAVALNPNLEKTHYNLGNAYIAQGKYDTAVIHYRQAILIKPDFFNAHQNLGNAFVALGKREMAIECFKIAISLKPDFSEAHLNMSLCHLLTGNFEIGWAEYEWRWQSTHMKVTNRDYKRPLWRGEESLAGKTILLHHEQGFGDTLQFCRYAKLVAAQSATVILVVPKTLKSVLANLEGITQIFDESEPLPLFDYHCPLMSLPRAFSTNINNIPGETPYVSCNQEARSIWQKKLGHKTRPSIGLVWSGSIAHKNDANRSISLSDLLGLVSEDFQFVSLQKELHPDDQPLLAMQKNIAHFGEDLTSFSDTAGLIANLDLVISVDTSVAHLAGAMGKPVWILLPFNPDWRWMLERSDSPWYPSAKLFRQPKMGDWNSVLSAVSKELKNTIFKV